MIGLQEMSGVASPPLSPLLNRPLKKVNRLIDSSNRLIRVPVRSTQSLKVVCNEKGGWLGRWQTFAIGLGTMAIEVCLPFNFDVVFDFKLFPGSTQVKLNF
jgi:hypothetical protein